MLDEDFPQFIEIDAEPVIDDPLEEKPDSPIRMANVNSSLSAGQTPVCKPFVLSYGTANLQNSTSVRLQKIKNKFVEVDFHRETPLPSAVQRHPGRERRRLLQGVMNRAASGRSVPSRAFTLAPSPTKSRMSLLSAKHMHIGMRAEAISPSKSLSMSRSTSTMSRTCTLQ